MKSRKSKKNRLRRWLLVVLLIVLGVCIVQYQKDRIVEEASQFLQRTVSRETGYDIRIGRVRGKLFGSLKFLDVRIEDPKRPEAERILFTAKEIRFRYRPLDFISKKFASRLQIEASSPKFYWRPSADKNFGFSGVSWLSGWAKKRHANVDVTLKDLDVHIGSTGLAVNGINFEFKNSAFSATVPMRHLLLAGVDVSSTLIVEGSLGGPAPDQILTGRVKSQGTIINWAPVPYESSLSFALSPDKLAIVSADILGGIRVAGDVSLKAPYEIDIALEAEDYPLNNWDSFMKTVKTIQLPETVDFKASFYGRPTQLNGAARVRIYDGWMRGRRYKALDLGLEAVYPSARLTDSRLLMEDGSAMKLADLTVDFKDLFKGATYRALFATASEDHVNVGEWAFKKSKGIHNEQEVLMQKYFGPNAKMKLRKFERDQLLAPDQQPRDMEVGFEYKLESDDSLKLEFRGEEEQIVGVERKVSF